MKQISQVPAYTMPTTTTLSNQHYLSPEEEKEAVLSAKHAELKAMQWRMRNKGVILTIDDVQIDEKAAIERANRLKALDIMRDERRIAEAKEKESLLSDLKAEWTAERMYKHLYSESLNRYNVEFKFTKGENKEAVTALCFFLSGDPRFEKDLGYSFNKGIYIRGPYGVGKTHMIKCLSTNGLNPIAMTSMFTAKESVREKGCFLLALNTLTYIDDVGTEETPMKYYGENINWFKEFIETSYMEEKPFNKIIFSSNLNIKDLALKYGERVADRLSQMFNIIDVRGKSKRLEN